VQEQLLALAHRPGLLLHECATLAFTFIAFIAISASNMGWGQRKRVAARYPLIEQIPEKLSVVVARHGLTELYLECSSPRVDLLARDRAVVTGLVQPTGKSHN